MLEKLANWFKNQDDLSKTLLICIGLVLFAVLLMLTPPISLTREFIIMGLTGIWFMVCYRLNYIGKQLISASLAIAEFSFIIIIYYFQNLYLKEFSSSYPIIIFMAIFANIFTKVLGRQKTFLLLLFYSGVIFGGHDIFGLEWWTNPIVELIEIPLLLFGGMISSIVHSVVTWELAKQDNLTALFHTINRVEQRQIEQGNNRDNAFTKIKGIVQSSPKKINDPHYDFKFNVDYPDWLNRGFSRATIVSHKELIKGINLDRGEPVEVEGYLISFVDKKINSRVEAVKITNIRKITTSKHLQLME